MKMASEDLLQDAYGYDYDQDYIGECGQEFTGYTHSQELELRNNVSEVSQSQLDAVKSENEKLQKENIQLKNEKRALVEEIDDLNTKVDHLKWHVSVYISALKNVPGGLAIYHDAFRKFRDSSKCPECVNTELVEKIKELEETIQSSFNSSSQ